MQHPAAGMYLGEIARRAILSLAEEGSLFATMPSKLQKAWALTTPQMSAIDGDEASDLSTTADMLQQAFQLPLEHASHRALQQVDSCTANVMRACTPLSGRCPHLSRLVMHISGRGAALHCNASCS